jgi:23S rRNA (uridine2552-2'-O)-methyltransferase
MSKAYDPKDPFYRRAKQQQLRARSAFKIDEIQARWRLVHSGDAVIDLGAAPGGFLQIIAQTVGPTGRILGVDVDAIRPLGGVVSTFQMDVMSPELLPTLRAALGRPRANVVASDLAPKTSGIREADEARSLGLARRALEVALATLLSGGHFLVKVFMGGDFEAFVAEVRTVFEDVKIVRPEATRSRSREVYVVGLRRRPFAPSGE